MVEDLGGGTDLENMSFNRYLEAWSILVSFSLWISHVAKGVRYGAKMLPLLMELCPFVGEGTSERVHCILWDKAVRIITISLAILILFCICIFFLLVKSVQ